jgi:hypothetical protein
MIREREPNLRQAPEASYSSRARRILSLQHSLGGLNAVLSDPPEASADAELVRLLTAWPALTEPIRRAIRVLLESSQNR